MREQALCQGEIDRMVFLLERDGRFAQERACIQHGNTTLQEHSIQVARLSLKIAAHWKLPVDRHALLRGALLHDYFLYDWHTPHDGHNMHGFTHPQTALRNALEDFDLTLKEQNIVARHMFPMTLVPPVTLEGWIVCIADKFCAARETASPYVHKYRRNL